MGLTFPTYREVLLQGPPALEAVGLLAGETAAGLALGLLGPGGEASILSLLVLPEHRGQGWGGRLLTALEDRLAGRGARVATGTYATGTRFAPALARVLARAGYDPPKPSMLIVRARYDEMRQAPWVERVPLRAPFRIGLWSEVPPAALEALRQQQAASPWIPADLLPWVNEPGHDARLSHVLWHGDAIVGWLIVHVMPNGVLRYTCSCIHPAHQRRGRLVPVFAAVMEAAARHGIHEGLWAVPHRHPAMVAFARRWMAPHAFSVSETAAVQRTLAPPEEAPGVSRSA